MQGHYRETEKHIEVLGCRPNHASSIYVQNHLTTRFTTIINVISLSYCTIHGQITIKIS